MRKTILLLCLMTFCFFGFAARAAQAQIAGGYNSVGTKDKEVRAAARYAVAAQGKRAKRSITLISINKAEQQVVAGMNYKVCLKVRDKRLTRVATAVIYKDLRGKRELTSWYWGNCNWDQ